MTKNIAFDTAFILKQDFEKGIINKYEEAEDYLLASNLINSLLIDFDFDVLSLLNRLIELSEIPFSYRIEKVRNWIDQLAELSFTGEGFSYSGKNDDLLVCYNAMITSLLIRMKYPSEDKILKGIEWIMEFQNIGRDLPNKWNGKRMLKYGGCMKKTPCYIGLVKSMIALSDYKSSDFYENDQLVEQKLENGLRYILDHNIYMRKSDNQPITNDIIKLTYPYSYKTNIVEILSLMRNNNMLNHPGCIAALDYLKKKRKKNGIWRVNSSYLPKSWIKFDEPRQDGLWITLEIEKIFIT